MNPAMQGVLFDILIEDLDVSIEQLHSDADLISDLGFDSLSFATGVAQIRSRLGVTLNQEEVFSCRTLGDLQRLVAAKSRSPELPAIATDPNKRCVGAGEPG